MYLLFCKPHRLRATRAPFFSAWRRCVGVTLAAIAWYPPKAPGVIYLRVVVNILKSDRLEVISCVSSILILTRRELSLLRQN